MMYEEMFDERERQAMDDVLHSHPQADGVAASRLKLSIRNQSSVYEQIRSWNIPLHNFRNELAGKVLKFKDVINTPYMMKIIVDILPSLDEVLEKATLSDAQTGRLSRETVYKTFTR